MEVKIADAAEKIVKEYLVLAGVSGEVAVEEVEDGLKLTIDPGKQIGLLIGRKGETLMALQSFLAVALKQKVGEWVNVAVDMGGWREKQEERLRQLADQAAERAKETGEAQYLYNLSPSERRVVHVALSERKEVTTESEGEGTGRYLVIKKA